MIRLAALLLASAGAAAAADDWIEAEGPGIAAARYDVEADVYPHRIMGDIREKLVLEAQDAAGRTYRVDLRDAGTGRNVFEDIAPRIVDADGDGINDVVTVETDPQAGASLAVYGLRQGALVKVAATPHIGQPFRWLAPVAITDLNGDNVVDLAYVETPHLGKVLRVWRWAPGGLTEVAQMSGLSNHRIGDETISGGMRDCGNGPEMVTANADWTRVVATRLVGVELQSRDLGPVQDGAFAAALACNSL